MTITPDTERPAVVAAHMARDDIHTADGCEVGTLCCPHCDLWIGDPDDPQIAHVSEWHDIPQCCDDNFAARSGV